MKAIRMTAAVVLALGGTLFATADMADIEWEHHQFTTARGDTVELAYVDEGGAPGADARLEMSGEWFGLSFQGEPTAAFRVDWSFAFRLKDGAPALTAVRVEDVTKAPAVVLVDDAAPKVQAGTWTGHSTPHETNDTDDAWMRAAGTSVRVFRVEATFADGGHSVVHQPAVYNDAAKLAVWSTPLKQLETRRRASGAMPAPIILERWRFGFDERTWEIGSQSSLRSQSLHEYVLAGERVEDWTELVSTQVFPRGPTARKMTDIFRSQLLGGCSKAHIEEIEASEDDVTLEWWHDGCKGNPPQHELKRMISRNGATYTLSYVSKTKKKTRLDPAKRVKWLAILGAASIE